MSPGQCCLSHLGEPRASLLHLLRPSLPAGSCSCGGRHTRPGDLPRKQGTSPTGFVACAGAVTSLWVPISECCVSPFSDLRCPPGSACLLRSEGWEGGWCPAGALQVAQVLLCSQRCFCLSSGPEGPQVLVEPSLGAELHWQCWVFAVFLPLFWQKKQVLAALLAVGHLVPVAGMGRLACKARMMGWPSMMTRSSSFPVFQERFQLLPQAGASLAMSQTFPVAQALALGRD